LAIAKKDLETIDARVADTVKEVIKGEFDHYLKDLSFRIGQAYDILDRQSVQSGSTPTVTSGKVYAEDLHLVGRHNITGYTVTNDSPAVGSIAWADLKMVYNGQETAIANGNTAMTYAWWSATTTPGVLQVSNTKPTLATGDVLLFLNKAGKHSVMLSDSNASLPQIVAINAVDSTAVQANAIGQTALQDDAVRSNHIFAGAVGGTELADGAVNRNNILGANTVIAGHLGNGAINRNAILGQNVVTATELADNAVDVNAIAANAVMSNKIADNAISRNTMLQANVVETAAIAANAVTTTEIKPGAVSATRLSIMRHLIF
jgi:hypothetical protein